MTIDEHHEMISSGYSNMTPWRCPRDVPEEELLTRIEDEAKKVKDMNNCIFNMHCPPFGTLLDQAPELDEEFRPVKQGGHVHMINVGSKAVRSAIEKYQPMIGLHGHIHESKAVDRLGKTLCINPGSEYTEGTLRGVILNLSDNGFESYALISG
jgi:Icc-related predicted phosphoesterase